MKTCCVCKLSKEMEEFHRDRSHKDGRCSTCKKCSLARHAVYYSENLEERTTYNKRYQKVNKKKIRDQTRCSIYGLALGEFDRLFAEQGGICAICGSPGGKRGIGVDHDHESGKIRALLCGPCNIGIGMLKDSSVLIQKAADYLKRHGK